MYQILPQFLLYSKITVKMHFMHRKFRKLPYNMVTEPKKENKISRFVSRENLCTREGQTDNTPVDK